MVKYSIQITPAIVIEIDEETGLVTVKKNGVVVGTQDTLDFIEGLNVTLTVTDSGTEIDITIAAGGGGATVTTNTVTVNAPATTAVWNHALNSTDVLCTPLGEPNGLWWLEIVDANNITVHLASVDITANHSFTVAVFT